MPLLGSFEVEAGKNWGYLEGSVRSILDTFNRATTSGSLGTSTNGPMWSTLTGTWYVNGSYQAETDNTVTSGVGSTYSLASFDLVDTNQLAYANVSPGMGIAFSVQNANNWWAVAGYDYYTYYSCNCGACTNCHSCTYCTNTCTSCGICGGVYSAGQFSCLTCCCSQSSGPNCSACGSYQFSCNCSTCYNYYNYLTVLQCVNGTVNTVSTLTINNGTSTNIDPASISLQLKNGTLNYYAYSTNISGIITQPYGLGTVLISGSLTISGTIGTKVGMIKSPSYTTQGTTISGFYGTGF